jgi:tetratricopeptide (TPR) repeat protein
VHNYLGIAYVCQKKFDQAVVEFEQEVRINPSHVFAHLNLGQIYWSAFQDGKRAIPHLKTALTLDPFFPDVPTPKELGYDIDVADRTPSGQSYYIRLTDTPLRSSAL